MNSIARTSVSLAAVAALGISFAAGAGWAGLERDDPQRRNGLALVSERIRTADDCADLLDHYVEGTLDLVGPYGWVSDGPVVSWGGVAENVEDSLVGTAMPALPQAAPRAGAPAMQDATSSGTGTNVQEAGVDEPDVVKTDGSLLVRVVDHELETYDVRGREPLRLAGLDLPHDLDAPELLLVGNRVVVLGTEVSRTDPDRTLTHQLIVDLTDPADPRVVDERRHDATLLAARLHGTTVRLVLGTGLPDLDFVTPEDDDYTEQGATRRNREILRASTVEDWLPEVTADGESSLLTACDAVHLPEDAPATGGVHVVGFDPADPDTGESLGLATDTEIVYVSDDRLYVATGGVGWGWCCGPVVGGRGIAVDAEWGRTDLHAFALDGLGASYLASGTVDGIVADRWSMDEHDGVLRVAVGASPATGNFNSILTLGVQDDDLVELGAVHKLGVNEQIQSMRWFDDLAVMVTFRQVDPLYAVDLSDPEHPVALGKLKIPGFSSYLHPLGPRRILGIGQGPNGGAQAAVFDLEDLTHPVQQAKVAFRAGSLAAAGTDPRQFTWLPGRRVALTVISSGWEGRTGWLAVLTLAHGELSKRMIEADYGYDVDRIRTLPLPDGRVLLVTGDDVQFLDL